MNCSVTEERIETKKYLITLVGSPNSGKTSIFNYLSGQRYKTVNYPGATVEYSVSKFLNHFDIDSNLLDSPGIISLNPSSPDEKVSIESLYEHPVYGKPDLIVVTVDSTQLSRHLFLAVQLIELGYNVLITLTMSDLLNNKGFKISKDKLSELLKCNVVEVNGRTGEGIQNLVNEIKINLNNKSENILNSHITNKISFNDDELIDIFKLTGEIENKILIQKNGKEIKDIESINKNFKILNNKNNRYDIKPDSNTIKYDKIFLHKYWGLLIFIGIMAVTFTSIFWLATPIMKLIDISFTYLSGEVMNLLGSHWYSHFISDGIITGTGSVLIFLPQIIILFLILGILEDTGYLARGAMLVDRPLSKIGLNGRSFVPMLSGFACAIPAVMAARTIQNRKERLLTIFIIPLMSCSARLPVYSLLVGFLFMNNPFRSGLVLASIYLFSIISSIIVAGIVNRFQYKLLKVKDNSSFIMELPTYRMPHLKFVFHHTIKNAGHYLKKAGPIILTLSMVLWFLTHYPVYNNSVNNLDNQTEQISHSYAATLGKIIEPVMKPIGMDWRVGVSLITTFTAREVFVSSLALIFKVTNNDETNLQSSIIAAMKDAKSEATGKPIFTAATIVGLIVFFVFSLQCISTIAIVKKETGGWRLPALQILIFTSTAYILTFITVNGLKLLGVN